MPSSLIFAGLVVVWLLILVPAVARHRQEVARPSVAALSGRVLVRPRSRPRCQEVDHMDEIDDPGPVTTRAVPSVPAPRAPRAADGRVWERPPPRYRPGRGGFDPEAAALAARARYAVRQRVVLGLLLTAVSTAVVAAFAVPGMWWVHALVDVALVGYLSYLRRQVRTEEAIRLRRAARMAGTRRPRDVEIPGHDVDESDDVDVRDDGAGADDGFTDDGFEDAADDGDDVHGDRAESGSADGGYDDAGREGDADADGDDRPALPRLTPAPPPPLPAGTALVDGEEDDPDLVDLDQPGRPGHRRAAGE